VSVSCVRYFAIVGVFSKAIESVLLRAQSRAGYVKIPKSFKLRHLAAGVKASPLAIAFHPPRLWSLP
jgi:hypothetical protein